MDVEQLLSHVQSVTDTFRKEAPAKRLYFNQLMTNPIRREDEHDQKTLMTSLLHETVTLPEFLQGTYIENADDLYWFYGGSMAWFLQFGQYAQYLEHAETIPEYERTLLSGSVIPQNVDMWMIAPRQSQERVWKGIKVWAKRFTQSMNALLAKGDFVWTPTQTQLLSTIIEEIGPIQQDAWRTKQKLYKTRRFKQEVIQPSDLRVTLDIFEKNPSCTLFSKCRSILMYLEHKHDLSIRKQFMYFEFPMDFQGSSLLHTIRQLDKNFVERYGGEHVTVNINRVPHQFDSIRTAYPLHAMPAFYQTHLPYTVSPHTFPTLNIFGLMLFKQFIPQKRTDKDYDVDHYRGKLVSYTLSGNETIQPEIDQHLQFALLLTYSLTFQRSPHINPYVLQNYFQKIIEDKTHEFREQFYQKCRGRINEMMKALPDWLRVPIPEFEPGASAVSKTIQTRRVKSTKTKTRKQSRVVSQTVIPSVLFEVGGNVIRRYVPEINKTNDIDYKIYYEQKHKAPFIKKMMVWAGIMCTTLQNTLWQDFFVSLINHQPIHHSIEGMYDFGERGQYQYKADMRFFDIQGNHMSFRSRYIQKTKQFPIHLFSIDYQTMVHLSIYKTLDGVQQEVITLHIPFLIPILDWSCIDTPSAKFKHLLALREEISPELVPSKQWLFDDFHTTYHTPSMYTMRIGAGKMEKDMSRIRLLYQSMETDYYDHALDVEYTPHQLQIWDDLLRTTSYTRTILHTIKQTYGTSFRSKHDLFAFMSTQFVQNRMLFRLLIEEHERADLHEKQARQRYMYHPMNMMPDYLWMSPILYTTMFVLTFLSEHGTNHKMNFSYKKMNMLSILKKEMPAKSCAYSGEFLALGQEYFTHVERPMLEKDIQELSLIRYAPVEKKIIYHMERIMALLFQSVEEECTDALSNAFYERDQFMTKVRRHREPIYQELLAFLQMQSMQSRSRRQSHQVLIRRNPKTRKRKTSRLSIRTPAEMVHASKRSRQTRRIR